MDERLGRRGFTLIILGKTPTIVQPGESPFNDSALGEDLESVKVLGFFDNMELPGEPGKLIFNKIDQLPSISTVCEKY